MQNYKRLRGHDNFCPRTHFLTYNNPLNSSLESSATAVIIIIHRRHLHTNFKPPSDTATNTKTSFKLVVEIGSVSGSCVSLYHRKDTAPFRLKTLLILAPEDSTCTCTCTCVHTHTPAGDQLICAFALSLIKSKLLWSHSKQHMQTWREHESGTSWSGIGRFRGGVWQDPTIHHQTQQNSTEFMSNPLALCVNETCRSGKSFFLFNLLPLSSSLFLPRTLCESDTNFSLVFSIKSCQLSSAASTLT